MVEKVIRRETKVAGRRHRPVQMRASASGAARLCESETGHSHSRTGRRTEVTS